MINKSVVVTKKVLIKNSLSGVAQLIITAILTFLCIPVFINKLGTDQYGVFAIVSVIGNLNLFANLGLNSALIKYVSEQGKCDESQYDIFASLVIICSIIIPLTILAFIFKDFILIQVLSVPVKYYEPAQVLYIALLISNMLLLIGQIFTAVLDSMQKIFITNLSQLVYSIIYWGGIITVVLCGKHLDWVGYAILLATVLWTIMILFFFGKYWGKIVCSDLKEKFIPAAKKQLLFGGKVYFSSFISFFNEPLFKILVSSFFGLSAVAYLEIGLKVRGQLTGLFSKILQPLYPYFSSLNDEKKLAFLVKDITSKLFLVILPMCALLTILCEDIVTLWLRTDVVNYSIFIVGIVVPYLFFSPLTQPIYTYLLAKGHPEKTIVLQLTAVLVNLFTFCTVHKLFGVYTLILSSGLSYMSSYILGIYYQRIYLHIKYKLSIKSILFSLSTGILFVLNAIVSMFINNEWINIFLITFILSFTTLLLYRRLKVLDMEDLNRYLGNNKVINRLFK